MQAKTVEKIARGGDGPAVCNRRRGFRTVAMGPQEIANNGGVSDAKGGPDEQTKGKIKLGSKSSKTAGKGLHRGVQEWGTGKAKGMLIGWKQRKLKSE